MSKHEAFPGWRYGPKGEAEIFEKAEDVPKGWKTRAAHWNPDNDSPAAKADDDKDDRPDVVAELKAYGVDFKGNAATVALIKQRDEVREGIRADLDKAGVEYDTNSDPSVLFELWKQIPDESND